MLATNNPAEKIKRQYFPQSFQITTWKDLKKELEKLLARTISSADDLIQFWKTVSELDKIREDTAADLYINMTRWTDNNEYKNEFNKFFKKVEAKAQPYDFKLKKKFYNNPFRNSIPEKYRHLSNIIKNEMELFREKNIPLLTKEQELAVKQREVMAKMTVAYEGREKTFQELSVYLENPDRQIREKVWRLMFDRLSLDKSNLNSLFDELKEIRVKIAKNAGFQNYRDYMHRVRGRLSYTPEDILRLHEVVEKTIVPLIEELNKERKEKLGIETLRPWDFNIDIEKAKSQPFNSPEELVVKGTKAMANVDVAFGQELSRMKERGFIDAEHRKGKAPGAYCYTLHEYSSSFLFMHAVGLRRDINVFFHEAGHAMHNLMDKDQAIIQYLNMPYEIMELASMSMELLSLDYWNEFLSSPDLKIIKKNELIDKIKLLPWGVVVDAFQHWIYLHPNHTPEERGHYFSLLLDRFKIGGDWTGIEKEKSMRWIMQMHIFEKPFYYIEYVMAQLGAIALYRNYKTNPRKTISNYKNFLRLAYTKPVSEICASAGIPFNFSLEYVSDLADFLQGELSF